VVKIRVRTVVAAGTLASDLTLKTLDESILLLQLLSQPRRRRNESLIPAGFYSPHQLDARAKNSTQNEKKRELKS